MISDSALWNWASPVWLVAFAILIGYVRAFRGAGRRQFGVLAVGLLILVLALVSPIGVLADGYLFSAHMVQHLLMLLIVPLCLLLSLPKQKLETWFARPRIDRIGRWASIAIVGWLLAVGAMWFWHVPTFCSASTQSYWLGAIRDVSFIVAGLVFWWPIYSPVTRYRIPPLSGITYLFSACLGCTLLGIYITFTTVSVCPAFANPVDRIGIVNMIYDAGLTSGMDQHLGGLLMWVPPCTIYVCAIVSLLCRWYSTMEVETSTAPSVSTAIEGQQ